MHKGSYYLVNGITVYRLIAAPFLIYLIFTDKIDLFKWLLAISFATDAIDGYLARRYDATSVLGSRLDSIADDLTIVAAIIGIFVLKPGFIGDQLPLVSILVGLYIFQNVAALIKYRKLTSFHTYAAKVAAVLQGGFLILIFFLPEPPLLLFYPAAIITIIDLAEELIMVFVLPKWKSDVRGLYWALKLRKKRA